VLVASDEDKVKDKEPAEIISEPAGPPSENLALTSWNAPSRYRSRYVRSRRWVIWPTTLPISDPLR
jgi:hypothetical protein